MTYFGKEAVVALALLVVVVGGARSQWSGAEGATPTGPSMRDVGAARGEARIATAPVLVDPCSDCAPSKTEDPDAGNWPPIWSSCITLDYENALYSKGDCICIWDEDAEPAADVCKQPQKSCKFSGTIVVTITNRPCATFGTSTGWQSGPEAFQKIYDLGDMQTPTPVTCGGDLNITLGIKFEGNEEEDTLTFTFLCDACPNTTDECED